MAPIEWLRALRETRNGYERLMSEAGSLPVAAWRLAKARCLVREVPTHVPTATEVRAAARELMMALGLAGQVPERGALASMCESQGMLVL